MALQDPYCAWDTREETCRGAQAWAKGSQSAFLQSVPTGQHVGCGSGIPPTAPSSGQRLQMGTVINQVVNKAELEGGDGQSVEKRGHGLHKGFDRPTVEVSVVLFSLETLIITVSAGAVAALVVGFVTGEKRRRRRG